MQAARCRLDASKHEELEQVALVDARIRGASGEQRVHDIGRPRVPLRHGCSHELDASRTPDGRPYRTTRPHARPKLAWLLSTAAAALRRRPRMRKVATPIVSRQRRWASRRSRRGAPEASGEPAASPLLCPCFGEVAKYEFAGPDSSARGEVRQRRVAGLALINIRHPGWEPRASAAGSSIRMLQVLARSSTGSPAAAFGQSITPVTVATSSTSTLNGCRSR